MSVYLGFDTSNYTTSAALLGPEGVVQQKRLLAVRPGEKGVRQSEALFQHVRNLPGLYEALLAGGRPEIRAVGVSVRPRDAEGSYMPCFLAGETAARTAAASLGVPFYGFSHQCGHIAAALYSAGKTELAKGPFLAFHVSGGTTDALLVTPSEQVFEARRVAGSLDLKAGQAVDRVGLMLGLSFPCGAALERLALRSNARFSLRPSMKGADCSLSGVENRSRKLLDEGRPPEDVALFCLLAVQCALDGMAQRLLGQYPGLPVLFAGGVMSDSILRDYFESRYGAFFAAPEFSCDNAAGAAVLARMKVEGL